MKYGQKLGVQFNKNLIKTNGHCYINKRQINDYKEYLMQFTTTICNGKKIEIIKLTNQLINNNMYKQKVKEQFHIFTDNKDNYTDTNKEAMEYVKHLIKEGYENIRVYHQTEWDEENGIFEDGDCIYSLGEYPY